MTDLTIASQAAASLHADLASGTVPQADVQALRAASRSLGSAGHAAAVNPIPGCLSAAYRAEAAGLAGLGRAVAGFGNAASETDSGGYGTARHILQAAIAAMQSGSANMATAMAELNRA